MKSVDIATIQPSDPFGGRGGTAGDNDLSDGVVAQDDLAAIGGQASMNVARELDCVQRRQIDLRHGLVMKNSKVSGQNDQRQEEFRVPVGHGLPVIDGV